jgi:hypothetical protein
MLVPADQDGEVVRRLGGGQAPGRQESRHEPAEQGQLVGRFG